MGWILTGRITSQLRQSRTSVYVPAYRNVRAIMVGRCSTKHSRVKSDNGSFTSSISVCCRCSTHSICLDNRKGDLTRSFRYHPLTLSTAIDVHPRDKGRKGTHQEQPLYSALSGQMPEAEAQVLTGCGKSPPAAFSHHSEAQRTAQRYDSPLRSLRLCWTAFLRILHGCSASSQLSIFVTATGGRMSFSAACKRFRQASGPLSRVSME